MCQLCAARTIFNSDDVAGTTFVTEGAGNAPLPVYSHDQIANYLTTGYWNSQGVGPIKFDVQAGGTLTFNILDLPADERFFAVAAMEAWAQATGINFVQSTSSAADIIFTNDDLNGAYSTWSSYGGGIISQSTVNIPTWWINGDEGRLDSYSFQTYIHEVGHALGLGHSGPYNGNATYRSDTTQSGHNTYLNDSWQATVMSYFSQTENTYVSGSYAYVVTPMVADLLAVHSLYGTPTTVHAGDTVYGNNSTAGGYLDSLASVTAPITATIYDNSGIDLVDLSHFGADQQVTLVAEEASNMGGGIGNLFIGRGVDIENLTTGAGNDELYGNALNNELSGGAGNDEMNGGDGDDILRGGAGADVHRGGAGTDTATYDDAANGGAGVNLAANLGWGAATGDTFESIENLTGSDFSDTLIGDAGANRIEGGDGNDTLDGRQGEDHLLGGAGNDILRGGWGAQDDILDGGSGDDTLEGGAGNDYLLGGAGRDHLDGGDGQDYADLRDIEGGGVWFDLSQGRSWGHYSGSDTYENIENIWGSIYSDILVGTDENNILIGGGGYDTVSGKGGNDVIYGGWGHDELNGGAGNDFMHGGHYNDTYTGGAGADTFAFNEAQDTITDFDAAEGDQLWIDDVLWGGGAKTDAELLAYASVTGGDLVFNFGYGNTLTLTGVTDESVLEGQMTVF